MLKNPYLKPPPSNPPGSMAEGLLCSNPAPVTLTHIVTVVTGVRSTVQNLDIREVLLARAHHVATVTAQPREKKSWYHNGVCPSPARSPTE